jgi:hypothetical protein
VPVQVPAAQEAVSAGVVPPLVMAAGTVSGLEPLTTLSLLVQQIPEARAELLGNTSAIDSLAAQLSIGRGHAERQAAVSVLRLFVEVRGCTP